MSENSNDNPKDGEIVPDGAPDVPADGANWLAFVSNYTERPDLFLSEVEKHDPGFTKRMNEDAQRRSERTAEARFKFGRVQAYTALGLSAIAAAVVLGAVIIAVWFGAGFWTIFALALFYAITQGGTFGFERIIEAIAELTGKGPSGPPQ